MPVYLVTGIQAAGKSTVAQALALRLRHLLAAQSCDTYAEAGFAVVVQDVVLAREAKRARCGDEAAL